MATRRELMEINRHLELLDLHLEVQETVDRYSLGLDCTLERIYCGEGWYYYDAPILADRERFLALQDDLRSIEFQNGPKTWNRNNPPVFPKELLDKLKEDVNV